MRIEDTEELSYEGRILKSVWCLTRSQWSYWITAVICGGSSGHYTDIRALNSTTFMKTHEKCNRQYTGWTQHLPAFICILSHKHQNTFKVCQICFEHTSHNAHYCSEWRVFLFMPRSKKRCCLKPWQHARQWLSGRSWLFLTNCLRWDCSPLNIGPGVQYER